VVGGRGDRGRGAVVVTAVPAPAATVAPDVARDAYAGAAARWAADAELLYRPLAEHLVERCPIAVAGAPVLDAGAGTGAASASLASRGAAVVATDRELSMVHYEKAGRPPGVAGDVVALPFASGVFAVAVAAFVVNHLAEPAAGLAELARVVRPGGAVLASTFASQRDPAKERLDDVATRFGWVAPPWSDVVHRRQGAIGTTSGLLAAAGAAGLRRADVTEADVRVAGVDRERFIRYRLGMPQYRAWYTGLAPAEVVRFHSTAVAALEPMDAFAPRVIELVAIVG